MSVRSPAENLHLAKGILGQDQIMKLLQLQQKQSPDVQDVDTINYLVYSPVNVAVSDVWTVQKSDDMAVPVPCYAGAEQGICRISSSARLRLPGTESPANPAILEATPAAIYGAGATSLSYAAPPQAAALTAAQSLAAWVYVPDESRIAADTDPVYGRGLGIRVGSDGRLRPYIRNPAGTLRPIGSWQPVSHNAWHSVAIAWNGTTAAAHIDGSPIGTRLERGGIRTSASHGLTFDTRYGIGLAYVWWLSGTMTAAHAADYHRGVLTDTDAAEITMYPMYPGKPLTQQPHATVGLCVVPSP